MTEAKPVQWPGKAYLKDGDDLGVPIINMIERIRNVGGPSSSNDDDGSAGKVSIQKGTPYSLQVINAGASSLTKWWSGAVGALGGITVVLGAISGFWADQDSATRMVLIGSMAVVLAAAFIAISTIVKADVCARGVASSAQKEATATMVKAMFAAYQYDAIPKQPQPPVYAPTYAIKTTPAGAWKQVKTFAWDEDQDRFIARLNIGGDVPVGEIKSVIELSDVLESLKNGSPV